MKIPKHVETTYRMIHGRNMKYGDQVYQMTHNNGEMYLWKLTNINDPSDVLFADPVIYSSGKKVYRIISPIEGDLGLISHVVLVIEFYKERSMA